MMNWKTWLETILQIAVVGLLLIMVLPLLLVLSLANLMFHEARSDANIVIAALGASGIGYGIYLALHGWTPDFPGVVLALSQMGFIILVLAWDGVAWLLWRWRPEWRKAIQRVEDDWEPTSPKRLSAWLERTGDKVATGIILTAIVAFMGFVGGLPIALGSTGWMMATLLCLFAGGVPIVGALLWPILATLAWLPRCGRRKFGEFFCAATKYPEVAIFGAPFEREKPKNTP